MLNAAVPFLLASKSTTAFTSQKPSTVRSAGVSSISKKGEHMKSLYQVFFALALLASGGVAQSQGKNPWYEQQRLSGQTMDRLGVTWTSCCDGGDVFRTRFQSVENDGSEWGKQHYQYWRDGQWLNIPPDVVHHAKTPDGQPVLFLYTYKDNPDIPAGTPLCFIIDEPGI